jgi:hypothetical protein
MDWLASGVERLLKAMQEQDFKEYHSAYDDCLWRVATSGREELQPFVTRVWQEPFCNLPIPLRVVMCRLFVLESKEHSAEVEQAVDFIRVHCTPTEEKGATSNFFHPRN